ncbi:lectin [Lentinula edodes]|uniref:Lectin n=1 Tax=Lentinula edodes TaxID=5353 RepID=A0A1Q3EE58_LENED|nr:lectin [Lentinula edodes]
MFTPGFLFGALALLGMLSNSVETVNAQVPGNTIPPLSLDSALWIWTGEPPGIPGMRAFRKTLPEGRSRAVCVTFAIAADDAYTVWVNGVEIGDNIRKGGDPGGSAFRELDIYSVSLSHTKNVIAVNATNVVSVDGVILTGVVQYEDGSQVTFVTDASWLTAGNIPPPDRFQLIDFDDSNWAHVAIIGPVGTQPWGVLRFAPFTGKACGQSDQPVGPDGPYPLACPVLPPLPHGAKSPYWDLRHQVDCEVRRLEEALFLCQREKQALIDKLLRLFKEIGGTDFCQDIQCT